MPALHRPTPTISQDELLAELSQLSISEVQDFVDGLDDDQRRWILNPLFDWEGAFARDEQKEPLGPWRVWLRQAGRGEGKTRSGSEWVRKQVELGLAKRIALVAETAADARDVMVEGPSGILAISPPWMFPIYEPSKRRLTWYNSDGSKRAVATCYSAEKPGQLRGPEHDLAWADELAKWRYLEAWDNLMLGLRIGANPRCMVTTTPKPTKILKDIRSRKSTVISGGSTYANRANLAQAFLDDIEDRYKGTDLEQQEIFAVLLEEASGACWKRRWIDDNRWDPRIHGEHPDLDALVIAIDPAASATSSSSETGIVIVGRAPVTVNGKTLPHFFVLEDRSGRYTPSGWANVAIDAFYTYEADEVIGEKNNGGDMVRSNLENSDDTVPIETVWASRGKVPRATPVANLYEQGRVHHVVSRLDASGNPTNPEDESGLRDLEDQLCQWEPGEGHPSPDRLDALVWGVSYLMPTGRDAKLDTNLDLGGAGLGRTSPWRGA